MTTTTYDGEQPTRLDVLLALLQKNGTAESIGSVHALSVRVPTMDFAMIEALAAHSGLSRNKIVCHLLAVALSEVWSGLDLESQAAVQKLNSVIARQLILSLDLGQADKGEI